MYEYLQDIHHSVYTGTSYPLFYRLLAITSKNAQYLLTFYNQEDLTDTHIYMVTVCLAYN